MGHIWEIASAGVISQVHVFVCQAFVGSDNMLLN